MTMRLGGPLFEDCSAPQKWIAALRAREYRAALCPLKSDADDATVSSYAEAARKADIVIAEVGAWSNPLSQKPEERKLALEKCKTQLELADRVGALCCVNIAGSLGEKWDGPCARDLTPEAFDLIVESVREIIDAVKPTRTHYTLEPMPWMFPDSADSYLKLIRAIDRDRFAVHFDPVNMVNSPSICFRNGGMIRDFFQRLGPRIKSCHAKDIILRDNLTTHLDEIRPGLGVLDYSVFLREAEKLNPDMPIILEHLMKEEYEPAGEYVKSKARENGIRY
jgi:sugar phosphate isomerase/epimerase